MGLISKIGDILSKTFKRGKALVPRIQKPKVIRAHNDFISSLIVLKDGRFASCSYDKTIKIFNPNTLECELELKHHSDGILSISQLETGEIISSSFDYNIKFWTLSKKTYQCETSPNGYWSRMEKIIRLSHNRLGSCSQNGIIKIWSANAPYECITTIQAHSKNANSLIELKNQKYLVSAGGDFDSKVIFWKNFTYECKKVFKDIECFSQNSLVETSDNKLIVGGRSHIGIINTATLEVELSLENKLFGNIFSIVESKNENVICGNEDGKILIFNTKTQNVKEMRGSHQDTISSLVLLNESTLVSSSYDKTIKVWKVKY